MTGSIRKWIGRLTLALAAGAGFGLTHGWMADPVQPAAAAIAPAGTAPVPSPSAAPDSPATADEALAPPSPSDLSPRRTIVVDVSQRVSPAVVSIGATKTTYVRENDPFGFDMYFPLYKYAKREFPYLGSGFIIDEQGHVLTNYHVVADAASISVTLPDRRSYTAKLLDADTYVDVALLQLEGLKPGEKLPTIPLGDSDNIMIGETVLAIGNPFGPLISDPRPSVSAGVISAVDRSFKPTPDQDSGVEHTYRNMIQTDAAINPGNSGGPLVDLDGRVVGINTFIFSNSGDSASVGFSIPINRARKVAREILKFGHVRPIRIDFEALNLTPGIRRYLQLNVDKGVVLNSIEIGGPAEKAGLQPGDVVVAADGIPVNDANDLMAHIMSRNVGDRVELKVIRQDKTLTVTYQVTEAKRAKGGGGGDGGTSI